MTCEEAAPLPHAYLDGELDLRSALDIERHLASCDGCSSAYRTLKSLREEIAHADLDFDSDAALKRIRASVERRAFQKRPAAWRIPALIAVAASLVAFAFFAPGRFGPGGNTGDREIVDSHLRSLLADHLFDVPSSDRHTVKPWFQGKIEFSPVVPDLSMEGFALAGGRLDVIDARKAAVLVYKRREHVINLWISQGSMSGSEPRLSDVNGFHLLRWSKDGLTYSAVSDLNPGELSTFAGAIRASR